MLTLNQALAKEDELIASGKATTKQLTELGAQVSLDTAPRYTQRSVTLLYGGRINGVSSDKYVGKMMQQGTDIRVIDKTRVGQFLQTRNSSKGGKTLRERQP